MNLPTLVSAFVFSSIASAFAITDADIAPAALVGKTLGFTIVNGGSPYATTGTWSGTFAASGNGFAVANITGDTLAISTTYAAAVDSGFTNVSLAKFVEGQSPATLTLYTMDGVGKYELSISDVFEVGLNGEFTISAPVVKGAEIEMLQGKKELVDGESKTDFGNIRVSKSGKAKTYTIKNTGTAPLTNLGFSVTGMNRGDFIVSSPKIGKIAPGTRVSFRVIFKPKDYGKRKAVLHFKSNDKDEKSFDIKLSGAGVGIK